MVDDVRQLLREQADIERVQDCSGAGDGEVELKVALVVPGKRGHPISLLDAEAAERPRETVESEQDGA